MGNFSHNPSLRGNTERNSMSKIFTICQTWLNIRQHRWQKHCKSWNMRKPLRSQTLLYNIGITQERSPVNKMNVRKFSVRAAITRYPALTSLGLSCLLCVMLVARMAPGVRLVKSVSCQYPDHSEVFSPQVDSEHRGAACKDGNRYRNFYQKWCFSKCQLLILG